MSTYVAPARPQPWGAILLDGGLVDPALTITDYQPHEGEVEHGQTLAVTATWKATAGSFELLTWLYRSVGTTSWRVAATGPASAPAYTYRLSPGAWEIRLHGAGPNGDAETGARRVVTVREKPGHVDPPETHGIVTAFRTEHGKYLRVRDDGLVDANGEAAGAWEMVEVIEVGE